MGAATALLHGFVFDQVVVSDLFLNLTQSFEDPISANLAMNR